jgi:hypothetical protein
MVVRHQAMMSEHDRPLLPAPVVCRGAAKPLRRARRKKKGGHGWGVYRGHRPPEGDDFGGRKNRKLESNKPSDLNLFSLTD